MIRFDLDGEPIACIKNFEEGAKITDKNIGMLFKQFRDIVIIDNRFSNNVSWSDAINNTKVLVEVFYNCLIDDYHTGINKRGNLYSNGVEIKIDVHQFNKLFNLFSDRGCSLSDLQIFENIKSDLTIECIDELMFKNKICSVNIERRDVSMIIEEQSQDTNLIGMLYRMFNSNKFWSWCFK